MQLSVYLCVYLFIKIYLFWKRERGEREGESVSRGREERKGQRENSKQAPYCQLGAQQGAQTHKLQDHDLSQNQESDA